MKATLEFPDGVFRRAKSAASAQGIALRAYVTKAAKEKLAADEREENGSRARLVGGLKDLHKETARINRLIENQFETIDPEEWH